MKWTRPEAGCCLQCRAGGNIYIIDGDKVDEWYLSVRPDKKKTVRTFETYREMYEAIAGTDVGTAYQERYRFAKNTVKPVEKLTEKDIRDMVKYDLTLDANAGGNLRTYCRNGQDYAVDMSGKRVWPYWMPQKISPVFYKESECREWADLYLEEKYGQRSLFDFI